MALQIGIVGLPNVGKSTLFNALTQTRGAQAANYPFCTIEPNVGIVEVRDSRLDELQKAVSAEKTIPAAVEFVDIAGIVRGASEGQGLGNKFLSHIRECDAILQVVRVFEDGNVIHVEDHVSPKRDIEIINTELILADLESLERASGQWEKKAKSGDKEAKEIFPLIERVLIALKEGKLARDADLTDEELVLLKPLHLLTMKPFLYAANMSEDELATVDISKLHELLGVGDAYGIMPISAKLEEELGDLTREERQEYLQDLGIMESGLDRMIRTAFDTLGLMYYFTAGEKEVRAWTIKKGWKAPQAAGVIHTDFEKGFIKADVVSWKDLVELGGWAKAREVGKVRLEGKEYVVSDGDVMLFKFNT